MQYSHSRIELFNQCKYKYNLRYNEKLKVYPNNTADNLLLIGTMLHEAIELGLKEAEKNYLDKFYIMENEQVEEVIKVQELLPKILQILPRGGVFEETISNSDFIGFIDYLIEVSPGIYDIYDFKYSNNIDRYLASPQLSEYKYQIEKTGKKIRNLYYLVVPKCQLKKKLNENTEELRIRIKKDLKDKYPEIHKVEYDPSQVIKFYEDIKKLNETSLWPKNVTNLCSWCEYEKYCLKGDETMILPSIERRNINKVDKKVVWIYGVPMSGKTTFSNKFPTPLMLNTDGNIRYVDAPYISIANQIEKNGRITNTVLAWDIFKDTISELEKKENEFKTIIIDLIEDLYEHCRLYIYQKLGIEHESDNGFKAWDVVTTEFLSTMKRVVHMDYENIIFLSHEDTTKDITKKSGDKVTSIRPNIREKVATKIAGMVDIVARVVVEGDNRTLEFKSDSIVFGGGRIPYLKDTSIPLDYEEFLRIYDVGNKEEPVQEEKKTRRKVEEPKEEVIEDTTVEDVEEVPEAEEIEVKTRRRKRG